MRVLVTGGTGFTGSHLVRRLLDRGHEVQVLDNQKGIVCDELIERGAKVEVASVTDGPALKRCVEGCEVVYHLAAAFRKVNLPRKVYHDTNVVAFRELLELSCSAGVEKIVYCSTQGVHGNVDNPPGDETSAIAPEDYYQQTKWEAEEIAAEFLKDGRIDITTLRPTAIYGPGDPGRFLMLFKQVKKGFFPFFGDGSALYHPLYIDNFVDAFELAAAKPAGCGQTYLIADDSYYTIKEIVLKIATIMEKDLKVVHLPFWALYGLSTAVELLYKPLPMDPPLFRRRADWFRQNRAFRIDKARNQLGYNPAVDLDDGLRRTYEYYRDTGYL